MIQDISYLLFMINASFCDFSVFFLLHNFNKFIISGEQFYTCIGIVSKSSCSSKQKCLLMLQFDMRTWGVYNYRARLKVLQLWMLVNSSFSVLVRFYVSDQFSFQHYLLTLQNLTTHYLGITWFLVCFLSWSSKHELPSVIDSSWNTFSFTSMSEILHSVPVWCSYHKKDLRNIIFLRFGKFAEHCSGTVLTVPLYSLLACFARAV